MGAQAVLGFSLTIGPVLRVYDNYAWRHRDVVRLT